MYVIFKFRENFIKIIEKLRYNRRGFWVYGGGSVVEEMFFKVRNNIRSY